MRNVKCKPQGQVFDKYSKMWRLLHRVMLKPLPTRNVIRVESVRTMTTPGYPWQTGQPEAQPREKAPKKPKSGKERALTKRDKKRKVKEKGLTRQQPRGLRATSIRTTRTSSWRRQKKQASHQVVRKSSPRVTFQAARWNAPTRLPRVLSRKRARKSFLPVTSGKA